MIGQTVREVLEGKVVLDIEGIDRLYLNLYQPMLQTGGGVATFFKGHRGAKVASTTLMAPMTHTFVKAIHDFAKREGVEIVAFDKGQRKDDVTRERLKTFRASEGVLYVGTAQERFATFRVTKKISVHTGQPYPWLTRSTVMCNHDYFYLVDEDFGPLFIKFASYFPYTARVCLNGHEYAKRQLAKEGIAFEALDNGVLSCADPVRLQQIADDLNETKIEALVRKWLSRLPDPFTAADHAAGFNPKLSILQAEFARTQVFDRPLSGRHLFEEIIRENLDLGRPSKVSLIFNRRIVKRTPGTFHTRVVTQGVIPSLAKSATNSPRSSSTSRKGAPCAPRPRSTTPMTSASDAASPTCPPCGPSASMPTAVCSKSRPSARTVPWPRGCSIRSPTRRLSRANALPAYALMTSGYWRCCRSCACFWGCPRDSAMRPYATGWPRRWPSPSRPTRQDA